MKRERRGLEAPASALPAILPAGCGFLRPLRGPASLSLVFPHPALGVVVALVLGAYRLGHPDAPRRWGSLVAFSPYCRGRPLLAVWGLLRP
jgi:hypothetical protein